MTRKISAEDLRAIAEGRLMMRMSNGVTVSRSLLAKVADELDNADQWLSTQSSWSQAMAAFAAENERLRKAVQRQVDNIDRWMETGIPANAEESQSIYEQMKYALEKGTAE